MSEEKYSELFEKLGLSESERMANIIGHEIRNALGNLTNACYLIKRAAPEVLSVNPQAKFPKHVNIMKGQ